jgi:hypothetical protein
VLGALAHAARRGSARHGVRLFGRVRGARKGRVVLTLRRRTARGWRAAGRLTVRLAAGRYSRVVSGLPRGRYRVRASFAGTESARPSRSRGRRFVVKVRAA